MSTMFGFFQKADASSAELRAARDGLSVTAAQAKVDELEAKLSKALIEGTDKEAEALEREISAANREVRRVTLAIEALTTKIAEVETRELEDKIARTAKDQEKIWYDMRDNLTAIDKTADELSRLLDLNHVQTTAFREATLFLVNAGRADLKLQPVVSEFCLQNGLQGDPYQDVSAFVLPGYWPKRHPDGPRLGKLKGLELPSRASAREPAARSG